MINYIITVVYLRVSGSWILEKISISLSTATNGPWKQWGGGSSEHKWPTAGGMGNAPPKNWICIKILYITNLEDIE